MAVGSGLDFVSSTQIEAAADAAGLDAATTAAIVDDYEAAQLRALKAGLLAAALIALISLAFTKDLPHGTLTLREGEADADRVGDPAGVPAA